MMHYRKGENIEKQLTKEELPFHDFLSKGTDFLWMHVKGGTNVKNVISYAKSALDKGEYKHIVWSGNGGGVVKTVSCAEILKRSYPLYQVNRTCYVTVEEHWVPQMEGLEEIVANRQIPSLHIYMSLEPIDDNVSGLQKPNTKTDFWVYNNDEDETSTSANNNSNRNEGKRKQNKNQELTNPSNNPETSNSADSNSFSITQNKHSRQKRNSTNRDPTTKNGNSQGHKTRKGNNTQKQTI